MRRSLEKKLSVKRNMNSYISAMLKNGIVIKEEDLKSVLIKNEKGELLDIKTYIQSLLIETLKSVLGGDKDERNT